MGPASGPHLWFPYLARPGTVSVPGRPPSAPVGPGRPRVPRLPRARRVPPRVRLRAASTSAPRTIPMLWTAPPVPPVLPIPARLRRVPAAARPRSRAPPLGASRPFPGASWRRRGALRRGVPADAEHTRHAAAPLRQDASSGAPGVAPGAPCGVHRPVRKPSWSGYGTATAGTPAGEGVRLRRRTRVFSTDVGTISRPQAGDCWTVPSVSTGHPGERGSPEVRRVWICGKPSSTGCGQHFVHRASRSVVHCPPTAQPALCTALATFSTPLSTVRQRDTLSHRTE